MVEEELRKYICQVRNEKKHVSHTSIFQKALMIKKDFLSGAGSPKFLPRMKNWYYFGLKKRLNLSICQVNGVGQKLPRGWEKKVEHIQVRVAKAQQPRNQQNSNDWLPGTSDDKMANTDNVPIWMEA
eukprot:4355717-Ditylum_brightwellii.AAC.1